MRFKAMARRGVTQVARVALQTPWLPGKRYLWQGIVQPYLLPYRIHTLAKSRFGAYFPIDTKDLIQRYIYFFGIFEPTITQYVIDTLAPGDIFIDIGANIGYYTVLAARLVGPTGKVFAVEASPSIFKILQETVARNGAANVIPLHAAVSDARREVKVYLHDESNLGRTTIMPAVAQRRDTAAEAVVTARPLAQLIDGAAICAARLIKIDVEGAEWNVLRGCQDLLAKLSERTEIILEVNRDALQDQDVRPADLLQLLWAAGYQGFLIENQYSVDFYTSKREYSLRPVDARDDGEFTVDGVTDVIFRRRR